MASIEGRLNFLERTLGSGGDADECTCADRGDVVVQWPEDDFAEKSIGGGTVAGVAICKRCGKPQAVINVVWPEDEEPDAGMI